MGESKWITTAEAAELSGYDPEYVRRLVRTKKVRAQKFGVVWQIDRAAFLAYCQESSQSKDQRRGPKPDN